jgi:hypothetical protein
MLHICPEAIKALDPNAEVLWPILLKKAGLHLRANGEVIENDGHRAAIIRNFAVPSLEQRLAGATTEVGRARIWWRESIACSEGDSPVPDLTQGGMHVLNAFILTPALKFPNHRVESMVRARQERLIEAGVEAHRKKGRPAKSLEEKQATRAQIQKRFRASLRSTLIPECV